MSERELIERAQRGDGRAYESLVRRYQELAFRTAFLITNDAGDAEDVAQSAFLKAYFHLSRFRPGAPFRPWMLQIVANEAKNARRARQRHLLRMSGHRNTEEIAAVQPELDNQLVATERSAWLVGHINAMSEADRQVIYCRYALELSETETASVLGCAQGTVKSRLHRAIGRLRDRLGADATDIGERLAEE